MKKLTTTAALAAACVLSFGVASVAGAQTADAPVKKLVVQFSASSLDSDKGVHQLYRRLMSAAERVCDAPQVGSFASESVVACRKQAMADAVAQIHNARLAEISAGYTKAG